MAAAAFAIQATPEASAAINALRARARRSYEGFERELRKQGCKVAGYRLLAPDSVGASDYCCKPLVENWRVITTFEPNLAIIVVVARHVERTFYADLTATLDISPVGQGREHKPDCCGEDGWPSTGETREQRRKPSRRTTSPGSTV